jgi:hypothetical protein
MIQSVVREFKANSSGIYFRFIDIFKLELCNRHYNYFHNSIFQFKML